MQQLAAGLGIGEKDVFEQGDGRVGFMNRLTQRPDAELHPRPVAQKPRQASLALG